jgi:hypothetical protein
MFPKARRQMRSVAMYRFLLGSQGPGCTGGAREPGFNARGASAVRGVHPLGQLDGDVCRAHEEHQTAIMELHDVAASPYAGRAEPGERGVEMVDREADMVETQPGQIGLLRIVEHRRSVKAEKLHLLVG